jgi:hypothetical protein
MKTYTHLHTHALVLLPLQDMQLFWEAFPAEGGAARTTYMFACEYRAVAGVMTHNS